MASSSQLFGRRRCFSPVYSWNGHLTGSVYTILVILLCWVQPSWQQKDALNDFCRRWGHQTTVIDRQLFIDGGMVDWNPLSQNPSNYSNSWLLYNDLNTSPAAVGMPQLQANLSKNASIPNVSGGVLWGDEVNKRFYLFGGDNFGTWPSSPNLYSYDMLYNQWEDFGPPNNGVTSVSYGMGVGISDLGQGYMLGGWQSNASIPGWSGPPIATNGLIKFDYQSGTWTNNTGPDRTGRAEGVMLYLPASRTGILVYFGGIQTPYNNQTVVPSPMNQIYVYDIQSSQWYTQTATGDIPGDRRRFCAGATWAPDQSSYNIYLYGGAGFGANASGFDDVYILSLPSFTWIKWWENAPGDARPHNMLSCNVVDGAQMLIVGGSFPLDQSTCDSPNSWGTHNLNLNEPVAGLPWNTYQPNLTSYAVPSAILSVVGGSPTGGATMQSPSAGFQNNDLNVYFRQKASAVNRTPTRAITTATGSSTSKHSGNKLASAALVGIIVGVVGIVGILAACFCILRIRKNRAHVPEVSVPIVPTYAAGNTSKMHPQRPDRSYDPQNPHIAQQRSKSTYQVLSSHAPYAVELAGTTSSARNYSNINADGNPIYSPHDEGVPPYTSNWHHPNPPPQNQKHFSPISSHPQQNQLSPVPTELDAESTIFSASPTPTYSTLGRMTSKKITPIHETYYST
ncbi:6d24870f-1839-4286-ab4a-165537742161 [Sclerotinia trifoliorum]|uniref:6d24870f-1839-4286-ab4a-165537742161 n=1 Tax=Sclerotinia trifoliorum TaxID=28548 RepID=A0A8H2W3U7_9HELO|nr:6d24870f-1839-4286-ab4a-165537742161 [Sclerotinia trifoliorum]